MGSIILALGLALPVGPTVQPTQAVDEIHEGKVVSVGENSITVLDRRDGDNDTFVVTAQTKITKNGKAAKLSDIKAGDVAKVTASGVEMDGKLIAKEISAAAAM